EIRTASYLLHPPLLDESGLSVALDIYIHGLAERSRMDIQLDIPEDLGRLTADLELVIFRVVQECLTNVHRHSGSKHAAISIRREQDKMCVRVTDQGRGLSPERLSEVESKGSRGVGLRGMRERVRQFQGELKIDSSEHGTTVTVELCIPQ